MSVSQELSPTTGAVTSSHTPGPWRLAPADCYVGDEQVPAGWTGLSVEGWGDFALVVTRMADDPFDHPQGVANARLIAAAPDLLKALKALHTVAEMTTFSDQFPAECEAARAAIAKAGAGAA